MAWKRKRILRYIGDTQWINADESDGYPTSQQLAVEMAAGRRRTFPFGLRNPAYHTNRGLNHSMSYLKQEIVKRILPPLSKTKNCHCTSVGLLRSSEVILIKWVSPVTNRDWSFWVCWVFEYLTKVACPPAFNAFSNSRFKFVKFACYTQSVCHQKSSAPPQMEGRDIFADITGWTLGQQWQMRKFLVILHKHPMPYDAVSASVFISVPKLGESKSGQMVSEKVKGA